MPAGWLLVVIGLLLPGPLAWGQNAKGIAKRTLVVQTNVPYSKLVRLDDGVVLATANERGTLRWVPEEITAQDCRLEVQAAYHLSEPLTLERKLRKSVPILNSVGMSILGASLFGMTLESTEGQSVTTGQWTAGAATGVLGYFWGAGNARNYIWAKSSRNVSVTLLHTPEYMDKLWVEVKAGGSIARIERFRADYPEFERQDEIELELGRLMYEDILANISRAAEAALADPNSLRATSEEVQDLIQDLDAWGERFGALASQPHSHQRDQLSIVLDLIERSPSASALDWAGAVPSFTHDRALPFTLAGFLSTWSSTESPRATLLMTLKWPSSSIAALVQCQTAQNAIPTFALADWTSKVNWDENRIEADSLKSHLSLWRETLSELESDLEIPGGSVTYAFEKRWASELAQWSRPMDLECLLSMQVMNAWIQLSREEAEAVMAEWTGVLLPQESTLSSVIRNCTNSKNLLPEKTLIPLTLLDESGLRPAVSDLHVEWGQQLGESAAPTWIKLPEENDADSTWTYAFTDGHEWRISTLVEERGETNQTSADQPRTAACFWVYNTSGQPQAMMLSEPYLQSYGSDDVDFMPPFAVSISSKGKAYPAIIDSITEGYNELKGHPGLSRRQLSSGRSERFWEVSDQIESLQYDLAPALNCAQSTIQPSKMSWSRVTQMETKLEGLEEDWMKLDEELTLKEKTGTFQYTFPGTASYIRVTISSKKTFSYKMFIEGDGTSRGSGYVFMDDLYLSETGSYFGTVEPNEVTLLGYDEIPLVRQ